MASDVGDLSPNRSPTTASSSSTHKPKAKRRRTTARSPASEDKLDLEEPLRDMRSSTPNSTSGQLKFTKTGRLSKATKGERVHACDECGKVYTRAEHLRRHRKNHSPGTLPCDVPGCGRAFFREDLLQRHKQRHNDPNGSPFGRSSTDDAHERTSSFRNAISSSNYTESTIPGKTLTGRLQRKENATRGEKSLHVHPLDDDTVGNALTVTPKPLSGYKPFDGIPRRGRIASTANIDSALGVSQWVTMSPRRNSSPLRHISPLQPYYQGSQHGLMSDATSFDPYLYPTASRSPNPAELPILTSVTDGGHAFQHISTPSSDISIGPPVSTTHDLRTFGNSAHIPRNPESRDMLESVDLQTPSIGMTLEYQSIEDSICDIESRYLSAFWQNIHPLWPVVHRPTFNFVTTSSLLKAAMIALGAQSTGDVNDFSSARILHERCAKVLKKRTIAGSHSYRIFDMQAVLLVEIYSLFRSRRPPLHPSAYFEDMCRQLINDPEAFPTPTSTDEFIPVLHHFGDALSGMDQDVQVEAKRRLLAGCYILDRQHSILFGRTTSETLTVSLGYLSFPQSLSMWNNSLEQSVTTAYGHFINDQQSHDCTYEAYNVISTLAQPSTAPYDVFRSSYLIAGLKDVMEGRADITWKPLDDDEASALLYVADHSPKTQLAYHTLMLCKNTPVRDLLAVAGESWIMAEKITSQAVYSAAQMESRSWARDDETGSNHNNAVYHALQILSICRTSSMSGLLYRNWAMHLATLVIWITAYVSNENLSRRRVIVDGNQPTSHELDKTLLNLIETGATTPITWLDAIAILLWTQSKLQQVNIPHNCGLTNGALDVLGKLISRGHENTWLR